MGKFFLENLLILWVFFGKNFSKFFVVIHANDLVFEARSLYFIESKKVISFSLAEIKGLIVPNLNFFFTNKDGKILFNLMLFFLKKKPELIQI